VDELDAEIRAIREQLEGWLRFVRDYPPGVLIDGLSASEIGEVLAVLDRLIPWLEQARTVGRGVRHRRRGVMSARR
jgi:hypothetical protein